MTFSVLRVVQVCFYKFNFLEFRTIFGKIPLLFFKRGDEGVSFFLV